MSNIFLYDEYVVKYRNKLLQSLWYHKMSLCSVKTLFIKETLWVSLYDDVMCAARGISWKVFLVGSPRRDLLRKLFEGRMQW